MNNLIKIVSAIIVLSLGCIRANAEEWTYMGSYPDVYVLSSDTWYYLPDSPPLVWDYSDEEWVPNPFGGRAFDITDTLDTVPVILNLVVPGSDTTIEIGFNYSGIEGGTFRIGDVAHFIDVAWVVDAQAGRCQLYGSLEEDNFDSGSFSLVLDFDSLTSGDYTLIGNLGLDSAKVSTFQGRFSLAAK